MAFLAPVRDAVADGVVCLRFFSRLPVPGGWDPGSAARPFGVAVRLLPVAALAIGACGAFAVLAATAVGVPAPLAALAGIATGLLASGGLHEDGLADMADGLGGGRSPEHKLRIMRDSRIGTYGALALAVALAWRIGAVTALLDRTAPWRVALAMLAVAAVSRALALLPLATLRPARSDGLGHGAGTLDPTALAVCAGLAAAIGLGVPVLAGVGLLHAGLACGGAMLGAAGVAALAHRQIGGQTGDIAGASQQLAEVGFYLGLLVFPAAR